MSNETKIRYRHEIKYLIDIKDYFVLKSRLSAILRPDLHAGKDNRYRIRSVYFDDAKNTDLMSKLAGLSERKKFRIRMYNQDTSFIRLEKKVKHDDVSYKLSAMLSKKEAESFLESNFSNLVDNPLINEFILTNNSSVLRPSVITDYCREAYLFDPGNVRITFDSDLKTALLNTDFFHPNLSLLPAIGSEQIILEIKYDAFLPDLIVDLIAACNGTQMAISKFALCKKYISLNDWEVQ